jgi:predicted nucleic acid-binding protein
LERRLESHAAELRVILVDTSVWIDFFSSVPGPSAKELRRMIEAETAVALTGVVVTEIVHGLRRDASAIEAYLSEFEMLEPLGFSTYLNAAAISRTARSKGINLARIDVPIAALALEYDATVFTLD